MPTNLSTRHTRSTKAHLNFGCHPGHLPPFRSLSQHVRADVKGNIVAGRGRPNKKRYATSPNLILQQMAKCDLWPWQIAVLVKPSSTIQKVREADGWGWEEHKWWRQNTKTGETNIWEGEAGKVEMNKTAETDMKTERVKPDRFRGKNQQSELSQGQTGTSENSGERCQKKLQKAN